MGKRKAAVPDRACSCDVCFYCGMPVSVRHEHDHFPVPRALGGTETVTACLNCHDLKDRWPLSRWPVEVAHAAMTAWVAALPPPGPARVLHAKMLATFAQAPDYGLRRGRLKGAA